MALHPPMRARGKNLLRGIRFMRVSCALPYVPVTVVSRRDKRFSFCFCDIGVRRPCVSLAVLSPPMDMCRHAGGSSSLLRVPLHRIDHPRL